MGRSTVQRVSQGLEWVLIVLGMAIFIVVFMQVLFRYLLKQPLYWSEELPRYLLIWITFLASALAQKESAHTNITFLLHRLPHKVRRWVRLLTDLVILGFLGIVVYSGALVSRITLHHRSTALQLPMASVYLALPVGGGLMIIYLLLRIYDAIRFESPWSNDDRFDR